MPDHFADQLAPVPALMAAAAATDDAARRRARVGQRLQAPVVLAKELATMDVLSDGRLEIGLGAGWMITDYEQAGHALRPRRRAHRPLRRGRCAVIKGASPAEPFSFAGAHYTITDYDGHPSRCSGRARRS